MTLTACSLEPEELHEQLERYRTIGRGATAVEHEPGRVVVSFADDPPIALIERTLAVERGCCPFFDIDYDPVTQRLAISVNQPDRLPSLHAIAHVLTEPGATGLVTARGTAEVRTVPDVTSCCSPTAPPTRCKPQDKQVCCGQPSSVGRTEAAPSRCGCVT